MKYFSCVFLFILFSSMSVFSQEKHIQHTVSKGETISEIAEQFNVSSKAIYELNPKAKKGIKFHTVLLIPTKVKKHTTSSPEIVTNSLEKTHEVLPKETLYGIAKKHNISLEVLYKINPELEKEGLKIGQIIKIPQTALDNLVLTETPEKAKEIQKTTVSEKIIPKQEVIGFPKLVEKEETSTEEIVREVLPKETLYSIARQYGIKVSDIQNANSTIGTKGLKVGQKIVVPVKVENNSNLVADKEAAKTEKYKNDSEQPKQIAVISQTVLNDNSDETEITHTVLPKETKYGIAKQYGITVAELEIQNPNIVKKLTKGSVLKIQSSKFIESTVPVEETVVKDKVVNEDLNVNTSMAHDDAFVDQLIMTASENIGTRYRTGGTTKDGFDCSGLMYSTFSTFDIRLPRSSIEMSSYGSIVNTENAQKGDLIFFKTNGRRQINHVGMVVEVLDGEIKFIHSSNHGGVIISSTKESYYEKNLVQINRVL
ncbi:peptidoglycan endopeptidase [Flavobacterium soyangense]|uniref:LysM peptidoglycan-binding domain-containing protein n=1 Tax=Flavobacterium soyangense TaxID=2023265 RepID=A0A930UE17_9FLAO|nr:peptidoglycan endopeptidase [Flavobacterium soyangense]MBF2709167.1 LysM peptidoglycan-binding domain-containing protein [Flavobacterium soyangense]